MMNKKIKQFFFVLIFSIGMTLLPLTLEASNFEATAIATQSNVVTVKGNIVDEKGEAVIGATVMQKGSSNATMTDLNGNFVLKVPSDATLVISYIGYTTQSVKAATSLKVVLKEANTALSEVVVVGYGTQKKANLTGSVSSVDSKDLGNRALTSVALGIQGKMPGVTIVNAGGNPGRDDSGTSIHVRGTGSFNNASPMIIVDGIESTMYDIDPNDIESMSVLKDAASAAIYGSKAANGVIIITTKRGQVSKSVVTYSGTFGWQSPTRLAKYVNSADYARLTNEARANEGYAPMYTDKDIALFENGQDPDGHANTDWQNLFYDQSGFQMTHNLRVSGGTEAIRYMASMGYTDQNGMIRNSDINKYNLRVNLYSKVSDRLDASFNMVYTREDIQRPTGPNGNDYTTYLYVLNKLSPMVPCYKTQAQQKFLIHRHDAAQKPEHGG